MNSLIDLVMASPWFFAVAFPAVFILGAGKGGFGSGLAAISTPMVALVVAPITAAAIVLPILIILDILSVYNYRKSVKWSIYWTMVPATVVGITIGALTVSHISDDFVRVFLGLIAIIFAIVQFAKDLLKHEAKPESKFRGVFWGTIAGFTSFISHSGGPPFQAYVLGLKLDKIIYAGTTALVFSSMNAIKLVPYFALGQFNIENLWISATLLPVAVAGVFFGIWAIKRVSQTFFYNFVYAAMIIIGIKLLWDGRGIFLSLLGY